MTYRICIKRDFGPGPGHWLPGAGNVGTGKYGFVKSGFVVTNGGCNVMPGAAWFRTVESAMRAIRALEETNGEPDAFWEVMRA